MKFHTFIAESAGQAVEQIRQELGPGAVVVNVRKLPAGGLARIFQRPRIEVVAGVPDSGGEPAGSDLLADLRGEICELKERIDGHSAGSPAEQGSQFAESSEYVSESPAQTACFQTGGRRTEASTLESMLSGAGLLPVHAHRVLDRVSGRLAGQTNASVARQLSAAHEALVELWPPAPPSDGDLHIFIGPPGSGKTTVLSKWLAQKVLVENRRARVLRLDGHIANTAESLSIFGEILGVPVERASSEAAVEEGETTFIDLPGVNFADSAALKLLARRLADFAGAQTHLVLNVCYEDHLLLRQARAFACCPVCDLILTHLDEDARWGKLWNLTLGTNFSVSFLSAGQNIPGDFLTPQPAALLGRLFPLNYRAGAPRVS